MNHNHHHSQASNDQCSSCSPPSHQRDWLLIGSMTIIAISVAAYFLFPRISLVNPALHEFNGSIVELLGKMWWGLLLGIAFVGVLSAVPKEFVMKILGRGGTMSGILRATAAGVLLDLCSHGILLVGSQLYRRGASLGQVMAFLIASPWNSLSLTLILWSLVGLKWTLGILLLSLLIALLSGLIFDQLVAHQILPANPNTAPAHDEFRFFTEARKQLKTVKWTPDTFIKIGRSGLHESKMILRWIAFGVVLAAAIRALVPPALYSSIFGPTAVGLLATMVIATILEVCSEGSMPVATDILLRAKAPGNAFAFLMTGVSTDYTEIMTLKETTGSWKIALFLPLVTTPQVILLSLLLNQLPV